MTNTVLRKPPFSECSRSHGTSDRRITLNDCNMELRALNGEAGGANRANATCRVLVGYGAISSQTVVGKRHNRAAQCQNAKVTASPTSETPHHRSEAAATRPALAALSA